MGESNGNSCETYREQLSQLLLEGQAKGAQTAPISGPLGDHLAACSGCRSFRAMLTGLGPAFELADLYTPGLKYRTLNRLAAEERPSDRSFLSLLIPVSLVSLLFWFAIPLLLYTWVFDYWLSRPWLSLLLSTLFLSSLGFLVVSMAFLALRRTNGGDQLKGRMKDLLEGFHA